LGQNLAGRPQNCSGPGRKTNTVSIMTLTTFVRMVAWAGLRGEHFPCRGKIRYPKMTGLGDLQNVRVWLLAPHRGLMADGRYRGIVLQKSLKPGR